MLNHYPPGSILELKCPNLRNVTLLVIKEDRPKLEADDSLIINAVINMFDNYYRFKDSAKVLIKLNKEQMPELHLIDNEIYNVIGVNNYFKGTLTKKVAALGLNISLLNHITMYLSSEDLIKKYSDAYYKLFNQVLSDDSKVLTATQKQSLLGMID